MPRDPAPMARITWARALNWRLRQHFLHEPTSEGAVAVARRLGGVQAQVMSYAEIAIGLRGGILPADVRTAVSTERALMKTWAMRGTLHLIPADDLPVYAAVLAAHRGSFTEAWARYYGVAMADLDALLATIPEALDGRALTREALAREVARLSNRPQLEQVLLGSWGSALKPAAYQGLLCFGPNEGRNVTFVAPRQWLGQWREVDADTALAAIVRRYLDAYGPATHNDFAHWFGIRPPQARRLFARVTDELVAVDVDGQQAWMTPAGAEALASVPESATVQLLPGFDAYTIGALPHIERLLPGPLRARISRTSGWISPVLLVDGRIAGVWKHEVRRGTAQITVEPFTRLSAQTRAAAEQYAATIGTLVGAPVETIWQTAIGG
jgi:hypothetical protein